MLILQDNSVPVQGKYILNLSKMPVEVVSKACHPALDAGSPEKEHWFSVDCESNPQ
jgi:hypothetical protein